MLHTINNDGSISWHCHNPICRYHNCQGWDNGIECAHHGEAQRGQPAGETLTAHLSDPGIRWTTPSDIELPPCPECGRKMTLHVYDEEELTPPIITYDEITHKILQVAPSLHPKYSKNVWKTTVEVTKKLNPHPTFAHLNVDQILQVQSDIKNKAPDAPLDWMLTESIQAEIKSVEQHPAVARHADFAQQLVAGGNVYQAPIESEESGQTIYTEAQVKDLVTRILQEHGVITSPRLPAVNPPNETSE